MRMGEGYKLIRNDWVGFLGLCLFLCFLGISVLGLLLTRGSEPILDPKKVRLHEKLKPPMCKASPETIANEKLPFGRFLLGTDDLGRDVFARMLQGTYVSMSVGFVSVGISVLIGVIIGGISGYYGDRNIGLITFLSLLLLIAGIILIISSNRSLGLLLPCLGVISLLLKKTRFLKQMDRQFIDVDSFIMRIVDIMLCFPSFFLILTVVVVLPPSIYNIMIVIGVTSWMGTARFVRAEFLALRELDFVKAAKLLGLSDMKIIFVHMLPNAIGPVLVSATLGVASAILVEAGLSFLGLGVPPPHATWGNILSDGKNYLFDAPWLTFIPGFTIMLVVLSFNLFGEALRDMVNPKLKS